MAADLEALIADLEAESGDLLSLLGTADVDVAVMDAPTPAEGWSVGDTVGHLWFFDREARRALEQPEEFVAALAQIAADIDDYMAGHLRVARDLGDELLDAFQAERAALVAAVRTADPSMRVPWYGPPMSPTSFTTARLMETWAHGQDVADAIGVRRTPTDRLRHVVHLGVRTRGFSYAVRGMAVPEAPVAVVLTAPSGGTWTYGDVDAAQRVQGSAEDFCLVVTQRRHLGEVDLHLTGDAAREWMAVAQAFAGGATLTDPARLEWSVPSGAG